MIIGAITDLQTMQRLVAHLRQELIFFRESLSEFTIFTSLQQTRNSREISREYIPRRAGTHPHLQGTVYSKRTPRQQDRSEQKRCERGANGRVPRAPHLRQRSVGRRALRRGQERARPGNGTGAIA